MGKHSKFIFVAVAMVILLMSAFVMASSDEKKSSVKGFVGNIEDLTVKNNDFRHVIYTAKQSQLVLMSLKPKEEIGMEAHPPDQFIRIEEGSGEVVINGKTTAIKPGSAVLIPGGIDHNVINTGEKAMKLYTIYAPPNHREGVVHRTRADAEKDTEHFDGKTTE